MRPFRRIPFHPRDRRVLCCFSREEFVGADETCGWRIEREVVTRERSEIKGTAQIADYRGFLVRSAQ